MTSPVPSYIKTGESMADIAQLVEQLICNQRVGSSSLSVGTIFKIWIYNYIHKKHSAENNVCPHKTKI